MKKIQPPTCSPSELFDDCVLGISDPTVQARLIAHKGLIEDANANYAASSATQTWCHLPRARHANPDQFIVGNLTKGDLVSLYTEGMVGSSGAARKKYDELKLLAHDECPYCGGCGEMVDEEGIGTIDHFLPKARFPIFSILPINLVPSCATCNGGMGSKFPTSPELQPLHPYFDAPHFFEEKWTTVTVSEDEPILVTFDVAAPATWSEKDRLRILEHFKCCKLRGRYRTKVASDISSLVEQRKTVHRNLTPEEFREVLKTVADNGALPINGWKRSLYHGLAESLWFCTNNFAA
ncbi:HNH endonuclease [Falsirhodobacter sp. alg1]|uniref:HNH endonuclease n=1 Tax=Falsirhodobacter sp. alg1 TaxID=1472418 RepID=UPI00128F281E|nr:hypothetical protein [Falsirhodobacter sp. alg1]